MNYHPLDLQPNDTHNTPSPFTIGEKPQSGMTSQFSPVGSYLQRLYSPTFHESKIFSANAKTDQNRPNPDRKLLSGHLNAPIMVDSNPKMGRFLKHPFE